MEVIFLDIRKLFGTITLVIIAAGIGIQATILLQSFSNAEMPFNMAAPNLCLGGLVQPNGGDEVPGGGWPGPT